VFRYHIAIVRDSSSNLYMFINGTEIGSTTASYTHNINVGAYLLRIGERKDGTHDLNGKIDELRISKGIARWTSNFTPPTSPYV